MQRLLILALLPLLATGSPAAAAVRPTQAEIVVTDPGDPKQTSLDLDILDGRRTAFALSCRGADGTLTCRLSRKGVVVGGASLRPDEALTAGGSRSTQCEAAGLRLTLSVSDLIQTRREAVADGYHFRVAAEAGGGRDAAPCPVMADV